MTRYSMFMCDNCNFIFENKDVVFYINDDLNEMTEEALGILSSRAMTASKISGFIHTWYCIHCKDFVDEYDIVSNKTKLSIRKVEKLIMKLSKHDKIIFTTNLKSIYHRNCPECGREIDAVWNFDKCPQCEKGNLKLINEYNLD